MSDDTKPQGQAPSSAPASFKVDFRDGLLTLRIFGPLLGASEVQLLDILKPHLEGVLIESFLLDMGGRDCINYHLIRVVAVIGKHLKTRGKSGVIVNETTHDFESLKNSGLLGDHLRLASQGNARPAVNSHGSPVRSVVLVVEDEKELADLVVGKLRGEGLECIHAESGSAALKVLGEPRQDGSAIDAVLSDIKMPQMTGLELLEKCRKDAVNVPFVFLTAYADKDKAVAALRLGAVDMLDKPFDFSQLVKTVRAALEVGIAVRMVESRLGYGGGKAVEAVKTGLTHIQKTKAAAKKAS